MVVDENNTSYSILRTPSFSIKWFFNEKKNKIKNIAYTYPRSIDLYFRFRRNLHYHILNC